MRKLKKNMNQLSDPILIVLHLKNFKTNQLNELKSTLKSIDLKSNINLARKIGKPFQNFCHSSTFILSFSELRFLSKIFTRTTSKQQKFLEMESSNVEYIILGGFFQDQVIDCVQLDKLLKFKPSKLNVLGNFGKYRKLNLLLKNQFIRLNFILKANNGN